MVTSIKKTLPPSFKPAHYSIKTFSYFYNFLKFSSGVTLLFLDSYSRYLVPYSWFAFSDNLFEKPIPRFERGRASPPDVPTLPARDGVGLYELGGGFI